VAYPRERRIPGPLHEELVEILDTLAVLTGHTAEIVTALPDGARPDVFRVGVASRSMFLGDAKHSEAPTDRAAQARLERYIQWVCLHVRQGGGATVVIGCASATQAHGWVDLLAELVHDEGHCCTVGVDRLQRLTYLGWAVVV
jgi:hypothetical protein